MLAHDALIEDYGLDEATVRLAEAVSLAVHVDMALLRRARLALVPDATSATEADLWFSDLVDSVTPSGLTLHRDVADQLRNRLAADSERFTRARTLVEAMHAQAPATIRLEEELIATAFGSPD